MYDFSIEAAIEWPVWLRWMSLNSWSNFTEGEILGAIMLLDYLEEQASNTVFLGKEV